MITIRQIKVEVTKSSNLEIIKKIAKKIKELYETDKDALKDYTKILYAQARLIEGLPIDNPTEITNLICNVLSK